MFVLFLLSTGVSVVSLKYWCVSLKLFMCLSFLLCTGVSVSVSVLSLEYWCFRCFS